MEEKGKGPNWGPKLRLYHKVSSFQWTLRINWKTLASPAAQQDYREVPTQCM